MFSYEFKIGDYNLQVSMNHIEKNIAAWKRVVDIRYTRFPSLKETYEGKW